MKLREDLIENFCEKQHMSIEDSEQQFKRIAEELVELIREPESLEECVDLLITVLVYARIAGFDGSALESEFERKMQVNLRKPVREGNGKVKKRRMKRREMKKRLAKGEDPLALSIEKWEDITKTLEKRVFPRLRLCLNRAEQGGKNFAFCEMYHQRFIFS